MYRYTVKNISCEHCAAAITAAIQSVDAKAFVDVDVANKAVIVDSQSDNKTLRKAMKKAGYKAKRLP